MCRQLNHPLTGNQLKKQYNTMENLYTYHAEKIKKIGIIPLPRLNYYMKKYNRRKRIYFTTLWINSLCNHYEDYSVAEIYWVAKCMGCELDDQYILDTIKKYNPNKTHFYIYTHFEWNKSALYKTFGNKKEVEKYKQSIRNKYSRKKVSEEKTSMVINLYENNKDISYRDMFTALKEKMCYNTINKKLNENNIVLEKKSKSFVSIEKKLDALFKYRIDSVSRKLTYQVLADYCQVSLKTFKRYILYNPEYKSKIELFNQSM